MRTCPALSSGGHAGSGAEGGASVKALHSEQSEGETEREREQNSWAFKIRRRSRASAAGTGPTRPAGQEKKGTIGFSIPSTVDIA